MLALPAVIAVTTPVSESTLAGAGTSSDSAGLVNVHRISPEVRPDNWAEGIWNCTTSPTCIVSSDGIKTPSGPGHAGLGEEAEDGHVCTLEFVLPRWPFAQIKSPAGGHARPRPTASVVHVTAYALPLGLVVTVATIRSD